MRHLALKKVHPEITLIKDGVIATDNNGNVVVLDEALITAEITRLQAEYDSKQYARDRAADYPSIADQLDTLYHGGIDAWKAEVKVVKDKYPKG